MINNLSIFFLLVEERVLYHYNFIFKYLYTMGNFWYRYTSEVVFPIDVTRLDILQPLFKSTCTEDPYSGTNDGWTLENLSKLYTAWRELNAGLYVTELKFQKLFQLKARDAIPIFKLFDHRKIGRVNMLHVMTFLALACVPKATEGGAATSNQPTALDSASVFEAIHFIVVLITQTKDHDGNEAQNARQKARHKRIVVQQQLATLIIDTMIDSVKTRFPHGRHPDENEVYRATSCLYDMCDVVVQPILPNIGKGKLFLDKKGKPSMLAEHLAERICQSPIITNFLEQFADCHLPDPVAIEATNNEHEESITDFQAVLDSGAESPKGRQMLAREGSNALLISVEGHMPKSAIPTPRVGSPSRVALQSRPTSPAPKKEKTTDTKPEPQFNEEGEPIPPPEPFVAEYYPIKTPANPQANNWLDALLKPLEIVPLRHRPFNPVKPGGTVLVAPVDGGKAEEKKLANVTGKAGIAAKSNKGRIKSFETLTTPQVEELHLVFRRCDKDNTGVVKMQDYISKYLLKIQNDENIEIVCVFYQYFTFFSFLSMFFFLPGWIRRGRLIRRIFCIVRWSSFKHAAPSKCWKGGKHLRMCCHTSYLWQRKLILMKLLTFSKTRRKDGRQNPKWQ